MNMGQPVARDAGEGRLQCVPDARAAPVVVPHCHDRLENLDTLRGVAALLVLLHHVGLRVEGVELFAAGYLCVDFFFMLSGFVMDRVYRPRFAAGMTAWRFLQKRIARLYPTIFIGITAGALVACLKGITTPELIWRYGSQLLFIPNLHSGTRGIYSLDGVQWSLLFELVANIAHVAFIWHFTQRHLSWAIGLSFLALVATAYHFDTLGVGDRGHNFLGGIPRVMFSYTLGVAINRLSLARQLPPISAHPYLLGGLFAAVVVALGLPMFGSWWVEAAVVATLFPAILVAGISAPPASVRVALWFGAISFPLYALHVPVLDLVDGLELPASVDKSLALAAALAVAALTSNLLDRVRSKLVEAGNARPIRTAY